MSRHKLLALLVQISRFGLAAMFLFAAGAKLVTVRDFASQVSNLVWDGWAWPTAVGVIVIELVTALLLVWPRTVRAGGVLAGVLLVGFAAYALYYTYVLGGEALECGCFGGIIASQLGVSTALRNLALLVPALLVVFAYPRPRRTLANNIEAQTTTPPLIEHREA